MEPMEACLLARDWDGLVRHCEEAELSARSCGRQATWQVYSGLLAVYLLQRDLANAKFLWKRTPDEYKQGGMQMPEIWEVGKCLWKKDSCRAHILLNSTTWPPHVQPIMASLVESLRMEMVDVVARSYSKISALELAGMLGISDVKVACDELDWELAGQFVLPKRPKAEAAAKSQKTQEHILTLTNYVSSLEN